MKGKRTNLSDATAAPAEFNEIPLTPLGLTSLGEFKRWARQQYLNGTLEALKENPDISNLDRREMMKACYEYIGKISMTTIEGLREFLSEDGMVRLLFMSLRLKNEDLEYHDTEEFIGGTENVEPAYKILAEISGWDVPKLDEIKADNVEDLVNRLGYLLGDPNITAATAGKILKNKLSELKKKEASKGKK